MDAVVRWHRYIVTFLSGENENNSNDHSPASCPGVINVTDLSQRVPSLTIPMVTIIPQIYIRRIGSR